MLRRTAYLASTAFVLSILTSTGAMASAQRTFVASYGSPANTVFNCSITKPCRAFSDAISVTTASGEVIVLDSAGYGPVSITQSVSIIAPAGIYAGITVFTGTGVDIHNTSTSVNVALRGLTINGQGGQNGIAYYAVLGSSLLVDDCNVSGMAAYGIYAGGPNSQLRVRNTVLRNNLYGVVVHGTFGGGPTGTLNGVHISGGSAGAIAYNQSRLTITDSAIVDADIAVGANGGDTLDITDVMVSRTAISGMTTAAFSLATGGSTTVRLVADANSINNIFSVVFKIDSSAGPAIVVYSPGNNTIGFNNGLISGGTLTTPCCMN